MTAPATDAPRSPLRAMYEVADAAWQLGVEYGLREPAWLGYAAAYLCAPSPYPMCGAEVRDAVVRAVECLTGAAKPDATRMATPAQAALTALVVERVDQLAGHHDPLDAYVRMVSRVTVVGLVIQAAMRRDWQTGGAS